MSELQRLKVRIKNASLDEFEGSIVLRGIVDRDSLKLLHVDDYQREALPLKSLSSILDAIQTGQRLPDIELGMRGQRYDVVQEEDGEVFVLSDAIYIIDGFQRVNAATHFLNTAGSTKSVRIGAIIHFDTTKEWEKERFRILNMERAKVSPNVLLRNLRDKHRSVEMLYNMSTGDRLFALYNRVSWKQRMVRGDLLSAVTLAKVVGALHSHKGGSIRSSITELAPALDRMVETIGIGNVRDNLRVFFDTVDQCWGLRMIQYTEMAPHIRATFLQVLARLFSDHKDFWLEGREEKVLTVTADMRRKLSQFPVADPHVLSLLASQGKARNLLYALIRDHINSGKRVHRMVSRHGEGAGMVEPEGEAPQDNLGDDKVA